MTATITDTRAIAHHMQANAQRGLLWGIGISLLIHLALLTVQVGGNGFGWRAPSSQLPQDSSTRMTARLVPRDTPAVPLPEATPSASEQRPSAAAKTTTVTVNASAPFPRAEQLDPPIPSTQPPELVMPAKAEPKAPAAVATMPPALPILPPPVADPVPPKPEVKAVVEAPAAPTPPALAAEPATAAPVAAPIPVAPPMPVAAPVPPPVVATPTPVAAPAPAAATPVLAQPSPSAVPAAAPTAAPAPATAPAAASPSPASAAPSAPASATSAAVLATGTTGTTGTTGAPGATGRPSATVTLPSPRTGDGVASGAPGPNGSERLPAFNMPPAKPEGFDPYKARSDVARDVARELNGQRSRVPSSVAPSLSQRERLAREVEESFLPLCPPTDGGMFAPNAPGVWTPSPSSANREVATAKDCRPRR